MKYKIRFYLTPLLILILSACNLTTYPLYPQYVGESTSCKWQPTNQCPPYVTYYNGTQAATLAITVKSGKLINVKGDVFDTKGANPTPITGRPAAIFVVNAEGAMFASNQSHLYMFHHSSILAGTPVAAAGEITVIDGVIETITTCSGHYRPDATLTKANVTSMLKDIGYTKAYNFVPCPKPDLDAFDELLKKNKALRSEQDSTRL
jgi:hypothetical protein